MLPGKFSFLMGGRVLIVFLFLFEEAIRIEDLLLIHLLNYVMFISQVVCCPEEKFYF